MLAANLVTFNWSEIEQPKIALWYTINKGVFLRITLIEHQNVSMCRNRCTTNKIFSNELQWYRVIFNFPHFFIASTHCRTFKVCGQKVWHKGKMMRSNYFHYISWWFNWLSKLKYSELKSPKANRSIIPFFKNAK